MVLLGVARNFSSFLHDIGSPWEVKLGNLSGELHISQGSNLFHHPATLKVVQERFALLHPERFPGSKVVLSFPLTYFFSSGPLLRRCDWGIASREGLLLSGDPALLTGGQFQNIFLLPWSISWSTQSQKCGSDTHRPCKELFSRICVTELLDRHLGSLDQVALAELWPAATLAQKEMESVKPKCSQGLKPSEGAWRTQMLEMKEGK